MIIEKEGESDQSNVRNSDYRQLTKVIDPGVRLIHHFVPGAQAIHFSVGGLLANALGIHLVEEQHRAQKYSPTTTKGAMGLILFGVLCDIIDGKLARLIRSEMTTQEEKDEDEKRGQAADPVIDNIGETIQSLESGYTAYKLGRPFGIAAAIFDLVTSNLPRTAKAAAGAIRGISLPEGYKIWDRRFWGTSLGRKGPDYLATLVPRDGEFPVQEVAKTTAGIANTIVAVERLNSIINPPTTATMLSNKERNHAGFRAVCLGLQTAVNFGIAAWGVRKALK